MMKTIIRNSKAFVVLAIICSLAGCGGGGGDGGGTGAATPPVDPTTQASGVATLVFGLPTTSGAVVTFPLTISNTQGKSVSGVVADIKFDSTVYIQPSAVLGDAASAAGKSITQSTPQAGILRVVIVDVGGKKIIADGVIARISFSIAPGSTANNTAFTIVPAATDSNGTPVTITGALP